MRTLVLGGIRSGKSRWAEQSLAAEPKVRYIATGTGTGSGEDESWRRRVAEHRSRRPRNWQTVETTAVATALRDDSHTATVVDDIGGWLTGVLDRRGWESPSVDADVEDLVAAVAAFAGPLVLVSPEVGLCVVSATAAGRRFTDEIGILNQRLAQHCARVVLVVAGQPMWVKS